MRCQEHLQERKCRGKIREETKHEREIKDRRGENEEDQGKSGKRAVNDPRGTCQPKCTEQDHGRLLWIPHTNPAGGERFCSGAADDPNPAMGEKHGESDREGYPDL